MLRDRHSRPEFHSKIRKSTEINQQKMVSILDRIKKDEGAETNIVERVVDFPQELVVVSSILRDLSGQLVKTKL